MKRRGENSCSTSPTISGGLTFEDGLNLNSLEDPRIYTHSLVVQSVTRAIYYDPLSPPSGVWRCPWFSSQQWCACGAIARSAHLKWKITEISARRELYIYIYIFIYAIEGGGRVWPRSSEKAMNAFFHGRWPDGLIGGTSTYRRSMRGAWVGNRFSIHRHHL